MDFVVVVGLFKTFLEGSLDHIIYRDYMIVNRRSVIYCSLACVRAVAKRPLSRFMPA